MSEAFRLILEALKLGRSRAALLARAAFAEDRALQLARTAERILPRNPRRAQRLMNRSAWWADRCKVLRERAGSA